MWREKLLSLVFATDGQRLCDLLDPPTPMPMFRRPMGSVQEVRLPAACGYSMGFLQHYYVKVSTHCVRRVTHGPAHTPELPGIAVNAKAASEDFATLRGAQRARSFFATL